MWRVTRGVLTGAAGLRDCIDLEVCIMVEAKKNNYYWALEGVLFPEGQVIILNYELEHELTPE